MPGYIKLYRDLQENPIWQQRPFSKGQAWIDMIFRCNHVCKPVTGFGLIKWVKRGEFISSNYKLAEAWGWSEASVRTFMRLLEYNKMILRKSFVKCSLYILQNYAYFQSTEIEDYNQIQNARKTHKKRTEHAQKTPNNNDKNVKNEKKNIYSEIFEQSFKIHPRPQAKADTFKNWQFLLGEFTEEQLLQFTQYYADYHNSIPENYRPFAYSSNNFFGKKAYYKDFMQLRKWEGKPKSEKKPANMDNFEQRKFDNDYYNNLFENGPKGSSP
jgi:hypothetical protein